MNRTYHHGALREALLAAAQTVLERDGIGGLTLRAAAREAGVSHAAPTHHFRNLPGLLSELAASGFGRLHRYLLEELVAVGQDETRRMEGLNRGYISFAQTSPGLFSLMFRSEQLDWTNENLAAAGAAAFRMLLPSTHEEDQSAKFSAPLPKLGGAMAHWAMVHGVATLLIDGRLDAVAREMSPGVTVNTLMDEILRTGVPATR